MCLVSDKLAGSMSGLAYEGVGGGLGMKVGTVGGCVELRWEEERKGKATEEGGYSGIFSVQLYRMLTKILL